jgi:hypothetical protein
MKRTLFMIFHVYLRYAGWHIMYVYYRLVFSINSELIIDQLVGFLIVKPAHRIQVLDLARVLTFFWIYSRILRQYAFSDRRCPRRQRGACGDFVNLEIYWLSPSEVLIGVGFTYMYSYG